MCQKIIFEEKNIIGVLKNYFWWSENIFWGSENILGSWNLFSGMKFVCLLDTWNKSVKLDDKNVPIYVILGVEHVLIH